MFFKLTDKYEDYKNLETYKDFIKIDEYRNVLDKSLEYIKEKYGVEPGEYEEKVCRVFLDMMTYKNYLDGDVHSLMDPVIVSIYLHDILCNEFQISLFNARFELEEIFKESGLAENHIEQVFQCIEGQYGPQTQIQRVKPDMIGPQMDMATAIWIVNNYYC